MFRTLDISASGLTAQRLHMDTVAGNIAQAQTTQNAEGEPSPFQRRLVIFQAEEAARQSSGGVGVSAEVQLDEQTPFRKVHDPGHPHADSEGYVNYPNVSIVTEFVNALEASRAYEANVNAMDITQQMIQSTFKIIA